MNEKSKKRISKFLSLVLRHQPETIGIELDPNGWVEVETLLTAMENSKHRQNVSLAQLEEVVSSNDKQRFEFDDARHRIRARQGHSVEIDLGLSPSVPPEYLMHGSSTDSIPLIRQSGLKKMNRHDVHLHVDDSLAVDVGGRHGKPVLLKIRAREMHKKGYQFFVTANDVWLTDNVPPEFIQFPEPDSARKP